MGFTIELYDISVEHGQVVTQTFCEELYFSYNWSNLSHIWYLRADMFGLQSPEVCKNLRRALATLDKQGVQAKTFDDDHNSWGWGVNMSEADRLGVFRYHLEYFLQVALQYPEAYFLVDHPHYVTINNVKYRLKSITEYMNSSSSSSSSEGSDDESE